MYKNDWTKYNVMVNTAINSIGVCSNTRQVPKEIEETVIIEKVIDGVISKEIVKEKRIIQEDVPYGRTPTDLEKEIIDKGIPYKIVNGYAVIDDITIEKQELEQELAALKQWFNEYFDKQKDQWLWQDDYVPSYDELFNKTYSNFEEIKKQANMVKNRIKRLIGYIKN